MIAIPVDMCICMAKNTNNNDVQLLNMCRIVKQLSSCCRNVCLVVNLLDLNNKQWKEKTQTRKKWKMTWRNVCAKRRLCSWFFFLGGCTTMAESNAYGVNSVGCTQIISSPVVSSWLGGDYSKPLLSFVVLCCVIFYFFVSFMFSNGVAFLDLVDMSSNIRPSNVNDYSENCIKLRNGKTVSILFFCVVFFCFLDSLNWKHCVGCVFVRCARAGAYDVSVMMHLNWTHPIGIVNGCMFVYARTLYA